MTLLTAKRSTALERPVPDMAANIRLGAASATSEPSAVRWIWPVLTLAVAAIALLTLRHELRAYDYRQIARAALALPSIRLWGAVLCTVVGYSALAGYDALALEYAGHRLAPRRTFFASFVAYAVSMNVGFSAITAASIRYRFWSTWGLSAPEIAQGIAFTTATFWLGVFTVGGVALLLGATPVSAFTVIPAIAWQVLGAGLVMAVVAYLTWSVIGGR
jgi:uncharacterized membrane protein YbhN (UPF0104 family)